MLKYDNCQDCRSQCEHAGKDREFVCPGGISCKVTSARFVIMPEGGNWSEMEASSAEMAYRAVCCWYSPKKRVAVYDPATGKTSVFTRKLDEAGNLLEVVKH